MIKKFEKSVYLCSGEICLFALEYFVEIESANSLVILGSSFVCHKSVEELLSIESQWHCPTSDHSHQLEISSSLVLT